MIFHLLPNFHSNLVTSISDYNFPASHSQYSAYWSCSWLSTFSTNGRIQPTTIQPTLITTTAQIPGSKYGKNSINLKQFGIFFLSPTEYFRSRRKYQKRLTHKKGKIISFTFIHSFLFLTLTLLYIL